MLKKEHVLGRIIGLIGPIGHIGLIKSMRDALKRACVRRKYAGGDASAPIKRE